MHTKLLRIITVLTLFEFQLAAFAQDGTRLLPDSFARTIGVQWKQDGRAVDLALSNPEGTWVVTNLLLEIRFAPSKTPFAGYLRADKTGRMVWVAPKPGEKIKESWFEPAPEKPFIKVEIQPGKASTSVHELKFNSEVVSITVLEGRGREQSALERLKSKVFEK